MDNRKARKVRRKKKEKIMKIIIPKPKTYSMEDLPQLNM